MTTRARLQNANDSKSLWNYTLSPGFSELDAHVLRLAIMRYGCGAWRAINRHFPLKTCGQLNLQTQRLFGQQALAEFQKVHIDPNKIKVINDKIDGFRKNTCLINTGNNVSAKERESRRQEHIRKYGISEELFTKIKVPIVLDAPTKCESVVDDIEKLREMYRAVYDIQLRIKHLRENNGKNAANIALKAKQAKKSNNKNVAQPAEKKQEEDDVEMVEKNGKNHNNEKKENDDNNDVKVDSDVEIVKVVENTQNKPADQPTFTAMMDTEMDEETAMALALSASMAQTNINTPAIEKKTKSKKKSTKKSAKKSSKKKSSAKKKKTGSTKKKKAGRKRKTISSDGDEAYVPPTQPKRKKIKK